MNPGEATNENVVVFGGTLTVSVEELLKHAHFKSTDAVILSGTLVEGIGTETSDFDMYVLCNESPLVDHFPTRSHHRTFSEHGRVTSTFDYLPGSELAVDVTYLTNAHVAALASTVDRMYEFLRARVKIYRASPLSRHDQRTIYRLFHAVPLSHAAAFSSLMQRFNRGKWCYCLYRSTAGSYPDFRDIVGCWRQGDYATAAHMSRKLGVANVVAFTHMMGNVNPDDKYILRYLAACEGASRDLVQRATQLIGFVSASAVSAKTYVEEWLSLLDDLFADTRVRLDSTAGFPTARDCEEIVRAELSSHIEWHSELSREFGYRNRLFLNDLPPLTSFLDPFDARFLAYLRRDQFRDWTGGNDAAGRSEIRTF